MHLIMQFVTTKQVELCNMTQLNQTFDPRDQQAVNVIDTNLCTVQYISQPVGSHM